MFLFHNLLTNECRILLSCGILIRYLGCALRNIVTVRSLLNSAISVVVQKCYENEKTEHQVEPLGCSAVISVCCMLWAAFILSFLKWRHDEVWHIWAGLWQMSTNIFPISSWQSADCELLLQDYQGDSLQFKSIMLFYIYIIGNKKSSSKKWYALNPLQFAYRSKRSRDDAIALNMHDVFTHWTKGTPVSLWCSLITVQHSMQSSPLWSVQCLWILSFLSGTPQVVKISSPMSSMLTLNTGTQQRCMLRLLLHSCFTHYCMAMYSSKIILNFANHTILGLIINRNNASYRDSIRA